MWGNIWLRSVFLFAVGCNISAAIAAVERFARSADEHQLLSANTGLDSEHKLALGHRLEPDLLLRRDRRAAVERFARSADSLLDDGTGISRGRYKREHRLDPNLAVRYLDDGTGISRGREKRAPEHPLDPNLAIRALEMALDRRAAARPAKRLDGDSSKELDEHLTWLGQGPALEYGEGPTKPDIILRTRTHIVLPLPGLDQSTEDRLDSEPEDVGPRLVQGPGYARSADDLSEPNGQQHKLESGHKLARFTRRDRRAAVERFARSADSLLDDGTGISRGRYKRAPEHRLDPNLALRRDRRASVGEFIRSAKRGSARASDHHHKRALGQQLEPHLALRRDRRAAVERFARSVGSDSKKHKKHHNHRHPHHPHSETATHPKSGGQSKADGKSSRLAESKNSAAPVNSLNSFVPLSELAHNDPQQPSGTAKQRLARSPEHGRSPSDGVFLRKKRDIADPFNELTKAATIGYLKEAEKNRHLNRERREADLRVQDLETPQLRLLSSAENKKGDDYVYTSKEHPDDDVL